MVKFGATCMLKGRPYLADRRAWQCAIHGAPPFFFVFRHGLQVVVVHQCKTLSHLQHTCIFTGGHHSMGDKMQ